MLLGVLNEVLYISYSSQTKTVIEVMVVEVLLSVVVVVAPLAVAVS